MTIKEWVQLAFALSNGLSFALTIRHSWRTKLAGSLVLVVAHPMVAVYFVATGQPIFTLGNAIMTCAGLYGCWRALMARRFARYNADLAEAVRSGWEKGFRRAQGPLADALADLDHRRAGD